MKRRDFLSVVATGAAAALLPRAALADAGSRSALVGAAWRGPRSGDPYFAGALHADWEARKLSIRYAVQLPTRPHGLLAEAGGGLLVTGARPGAWLLRCDGDGKVMQRFDIEGEDACRLCGHAALAAGGDALFTSETDYASGRGRMGVRDRRTLRKIAEWDAHGIEPHQMLLDGAGNIVLANGGIPRSLSDRKIDLQRMDASLVKLDPGSGKLLGQWRLDDRRLSLRHMAWNRSPADGGALLGIAMQAEHDDAAARARAPILAVFDGDRLTVAATANDGFGYAGDIAPAHRGGFVVSSNQAGEALLWHPGVPGRLTPIVKMQEPYALAPWHGPERGGGVLIATALGLGRWHPSAKPLLLPWPQPMALDNHWVLISEA